MEKLLMEQNGLGWRGKSKQFCLKLYISRIQRQADGYLCGGTVIHPHFVLTSAECCKTWPMNVTFSSKTITVHEGKMP